MRDAGAGGNPSRYDPKISVLERKCNMKNVEYTYETATVVALRSLHAIPREVTNAAAREAACMLAVLHPLKIAVTTNQVFCEPLKELKAPRPLDAALGHARAM